MKIYRYIVMMIDDSYPIKKYKTLSGAKGYIKKLSSQDKARVKIVKIG